jgi:hypothetical protein
MHRALQNRCRRAAESDRAQHQRDREKDNAGWRETKHNRLAGNQADHQDGGYCKANGGGSRPKTQIDGPLQLVVERGSALIASGREHNQGNQHPADGRWCF